MKDGDDKPPQIWYYSTPTQLAALLDTLDGIRWERNLVSAIKDIKEDLERQMAITKNLTDDARQNKKCALSEDDGW